MVEPLEETRSELTFVTEFVTASLYTTLHRTSTDSRHSRHRPPGASSTASDARGEVDLDEVEIQKGVLQIARGLAFLHGPAKSVHLNLTPQAILINAKVSCAVQT
jgi:SCY1-like protein 2